MFCLKNTAVFPEEDNRSTETLKNVKDLDQFFSGLIQKLKQYNKTKLHSVKEKTLKIYLNNC